MRIRTARLMMLLVTAAALVLSPSLGSAKKPLVPAAGIVAGTFTYHPGGTARCEYRFTTFVGTMPAGPTSYVIRSGHGKMQHLCYRGGLLRPPSLTPLSLFLTGVTPQRQQFQWSCSGLIDYYDDDYPQTLGCQTVGFEGTFKIILDVHSWCLSGECADSPEGGGASGSGIAEGAYVVPARWMPAALVEELDADQGPVPIP